MLCCASSRTSRGGLGYPVARLDTGPKQGNAEGLYRDEGYVEVPDFNGNPVAVVLGREAALTRTGPARQLHK